MAKGLLFQIRPTSVQIQFYLEFYDIRQKNQVSIFSSIKELIITRCLPQINIIEHIKYLVKHLI